ncbi:hypothetical protein WN944_009638 [Citrus x changshan-huyou]|uniref:PH domain-containing protein n=1 Tax=Citrus x changshan-huyou TaxID=2935761 RepID=A0AAP0MWJ0_9ROSI
MQICKDEDEAEVWFSGLKALISRNHHRKWRTESRSDGIPSEANSPRTYTRRSSPLNSPFGSNDSLQKAVVSRATSSISRRPSPPRLTTPTPTLGGLASPKIVVDDAKRTNDSLSQEVENLTRKAQLQEVELERTTKQLKKAIAIAGEETAKCRAAKEVDDMACQLEPGGYIVSCTRED